MSPRARVSNWESQLGDPLSHHEIGKPNGQPRRWFFWKVCNELKGAPAGALDQAQIKSRMSTGPIVHSYLDSIVTQVDGQLRHVNFLTENRLIDYQNHFARTLTMWKVLVRCYITLTST